ncbi:3063_t:CDS:2 [Funneliformis geosporum]|nr:3063_t:CDS:2 [Funneliformis geosporum]
MLLHKGYGNAGQSKKSSQRKGASKASEIDIVHPRMKSNRGSLCKFHSRRLSLSLTRDLEHFEIFNTGIALL